MSFLFSLNKIRRLYYTLSQEVLEPAPSPTIKRWLFIGDIFLLIYANRIFFLMYIWQNNFEFKYFNIRYYDVVSAYIANNVDSYDSYYMLVIYLFQFFNFYCKRSFYLLNNQNITWILWHELIVVNQNEYERCQFNKNKFDFVLNKKMNVLKRNFQTNYPIFKRFVSIKVTHFFFQFYAKILIWLNLENVDKERFFGKPLKVIPLLSRKVRLNVLFFCILTDKVFYFLQYMFCKY